MAKVSLIIIMLSNTIVMTNCDVYNDYHLIAEYIEKDVNMKGLKYT